MTHITKEIKTALGVLVTGSLVLALVISIQPSISSANEVPNILIGSDMTIGSTGPNVVMLQGLLSELGYLQVPIGIPFGYFGTLTKDSLARYQRDMSVSPTMGYFGPKTKIAIHDQFASRGWLSLLGW